MIVQNVLGEHISLNFTAKNALLSALLSKCMELLLKSAHIICGMHKRDELTWTKIVEEELRNLEEQFYPSEVVLVRACQSQLTGSGLITLFEIIKPRVFISSTIDVHFSNRKCKFASLQTEKTSRK